MLVAGCEARSLAELQEIAGKLKNTLVCAGVKEFGWVFPGRNELALTNEALVFKTINRHTLPRLCPAGEGLRSKSLDYLLVGASRKLEELPHFSREGVCTGIIERWVKVWYIGRELFELSDDRRGLYWPKR